MNTLFIYPDWASLTMVAMALFLTGCSFIYRGRPFRPISPLTFFCLFASLACLASNWLVFTVFLELSSISLFVAIGKKDGAAARFYLYTQLAGGSMLLMAVAAASPGGLPLPFDTIPDRYFPLFALSLGIKAAFPGLHFWLPRTHSRASSEVSALLSGYSIKMALYGLFRALKGPSPELMIIGLIMALYGVFFALMQHDAKRLLAYHTISQVGLVLVALASGTDIGRAAAIFHLVVHGVFKALLFLCAGTLEVVYGTRDLGFLGRAGKDMPLLFLLFLAGATAIAGVPGTCGYASKALIKVSLHDFPWAAWGLQLAGIGTALSFCKFGYYGFIRLAGSPKKVSPIVSAVSNRLVAMGILASVTVYLGISPSSLPFFPESAVSLRSMDALLGAGIPLVLGITFFALFSRLFIPGRGHFPDLEDFLPILSTLFASCLDLLRLVHAGRLRLYIVVLVACLLGFFAFP